MRFKGSYQSAFIAAIGLHVGIAFMLLAEVSLRPVLTKEVKNEAGDRLSITPQETAKSDIINAVSIESRDIAEAVDHLKQARAASLKIEQERQKALIKQANMARNERLLEQKKIAKLKDDAIKLTLAHKKQIETEQHYLKQLSEQKEHEKKQLEKLKHTQDVLEKKHQQEIEKQVALKKKLAADLAQDEQLRTEKVMAEKAQAQLAQQKQAALQQAAEEASKKAKLAGEVNKYKAMIVNAISQRWILPDNVNKSLSSQFRIRLAPDGSVLSVSLTRSSGDAILDRSAQTAIYKASPLPVPADLVVFDLFRDISLTVRPETSRS